MSGGPRVRTRDCSACSACAPAPALIFLLACLFEGSRSIPAVLRAQAPRPRSLGALRVQPARVAMPAHGLLRSAASVYSGGMRLGAPLLDNALVLLVVLLARNPHLLEGPLRARNREEAARVF